MAVKTLTNGIVLRTVHTDRFKTDYLTLTWVRPMTDRENTKNALLPYVLKAGCAPYGNLKQLNIALKENYGATLACVLRKRGNYQCFGYAMSFLKDKYAFHGDCISDKCLEILSHVVLSPVQKNGAFDADILRVEKNNLKEKIESRSNDKIVYGIDRCSSLMCKGSPFALSELGEVEGLTESVNTPDIMFQHYRKVMESSHVEVFYVGGMDIDQVAEKLEQKLGELHSVDMPLTAGPLDVSGGEKGTITETLPVNQCKLTMGFTTGVMVDDADYCPMVMANMVFGGGPTSKLFLNVREKLSLCYYAAARYNKLNGQVLVYSGVQAENVQKAEDEIKNQLSQLQQGNVTEEEFEAARKSVVNALRASQDSPSALEDFGLSEHFGSHPRTVEQFIQELLQVTKADAVRAAGKMQLHTIHVLKGEGGQDE